MKLFGFQFPTIEKPKNKTLISLPAADSKDGALFVDGGYMGYGVNFESSPTEDENALITQYLDLSLQPEIEKAVDDVINEFFSYDDDTYAVKLNLDEIEDSVLSKKVKERMMEEFKNCLDLLSFKSDCYEIVRRWYVTGRLYYQKVINENNPKEGLTELIFIDPRKIRKIRQMEHGQRGFNTFNNNPVIENQEYDEYYIYNPTGIDQTRPEGVRLTTDSVVYVHSGLFDKSNKTVLSYLHKAIRAYNLISQLEDASVIYTLARAPERRLFNIEVGSMSPMKAEQHVKEQMNRNRRKIVYDPVTGLAKDNYRFMSMLEDWWFAKRDGKGTTIDVIGGQTSFSDLANLDFFRNKLYDSLNVPRARFNSEGGGNFNFSSEVTREELKFQKFISRLRKRFSFFFEDILGTQLILKGILTEEEWETIKGDVDYDYIQDSFFSEKKWTEVQTQRLATFRDAQDLLAQGFISKGWIRKNILHISDEDADEIKKELMDEVKESQDTPELNPVLTPDNGMVSPLLQPMLMPPDQQFYDEDDPEGKVPFR